MKIRLLTPVTHDGELLAEGNTLDLPEEQAQQLLDVGAAERTGLAAQMAIESASKAVQTQVKPAVKPATKKANKAAK